jgi:hypothetical protein
MRRRSSPADRTGSAAEVSMPQPSGGRTDRNRSSYIKAKANPATARSTALRTPKSAPAP